VKVIKNIVVPTGNILIVQGERGNLECLSLGDYGKDVNIKSNAIDGLDRPLNQVIHTKLLPLEDKWVITISTQYGCSRSEERRVGKECTG
jgi:23S rRNA (adenine2503-C2)-methyltransferase